MAGSLCAFQSKEEEKEEEEEVPENLFQVQGKAQGSAGFLMKVAPLAWKLGKTRLSGRPVEGVIRFESFQKCLCSPLLGFTVLGGQLRLWSSRRRENQENRKFLVSCNSTRENSSLGILAATRQ